MHYPILRFHYIGGLPWLMEQAILRPLAANSGD